MENKSQSPVLTKKHSLADIRFPSPGSISTHGCGMIIQQQQFRTISNNV
jgi:ubiquitin carboxyl-terminal hydrolase 22/27/51